MPRITDDTLLDIVRARAKGQAVKAIAAAYGFTSQFVSTATVRVKRADEEHVKRDLSAHYWPDKAGLK